jgi:Ras GTPase-activating-like protein IQGAP2/3
MARETFIQLKEKFPGAPDEVYAACIGRLVYYRYLNPAILYVFTFGPLVTGAYHPHLQIA